MLITIMIKYCKIITMKIICKTLKFLHITHTWNSKRINEYLKENTVSYCSHANRHKEKDDLVFRLQCILVLEWHFYVRVTKLY